MEAGIDGEVRSDGSMRPDCGGLAVGSTSILTADRSFLSSLFSLTFLEARNEIPGFFL